MSNPITQQQISRTFAFSNLSYKTQRLVIIVGFSLIPILLLLTFAYLPLYNLIRDSFYNWNGVRTRKFIGFDNYAAIISDPKYFSVFKISLYYFLSSFIQLGLALYFATVLTFRVRGKNFFKGFLFFPSLLNGVAIGFIFLYFFKPDGTLDAILKLFGLGDYVQLWIGNQNIVNWSLAGSSIWRYMGTNFVIFLGAIQSVSSDIYEAAEIDGANKWHMFRHIIMPSIRRIVELNVILSVSGSIQVFDIPFIMTKGSNGTTTFVIQTVDTAFKFSKFGLASALGVVLLIIVVIVTLVQNKLFGDKEGVI
ncbi:MAG: sugar ABC transporter permease [Paenibacillaceae bacterium]